MTVTSWQHPADHIDQSPAVPLRGRTAIGRAAQPPNKRGDGAALLCLGTTDPLIEPLGEDSAQAIIERRADHCFVLNRSAESNSPCLLNGAPFTERRLIINDRLSFGDDFHYDYDGLSLTRVQKRQGAQIEVSHVSKSYPGRGLFHRRGQVDAVRDISLTIQPNEFIGVLGPSGCGKSTFLKMLAGALPPSSGRITLNGLSSQDHPLLVRSLVGLVPQDDIVHPELTVQDALDISAQLRLPAGIPAAARRDLTDKILADLRMWPWLFSRVGDLSGGQRKRISIAVEILKKSSVLLLDEPTSGLDPAKEEDLMELLSEMAQQGRTVICTTHVLDRAYLFSRICLMARGMLVYFGYSEDAPDYFDRKNLLDVYRLLESPSFIPVVWNGQSKYHPPAAGSPGDRAAAARDAVKRQPKKEEETGSLRTLHFESGTVAIVNGPGGSAKLPELAALAAQRSGHLVLDLSRTTQDQPTAENLHRIFEAVLEEGQTLSVVNPPAVFLELVRLHRHEQKLKTFTSLDSALQDANLGTPLTGPPPRPGTRLRPILIGLSLLMIGLAAWLSWLILHGDLHSFLTHLKSSRGR